MNDSAAALVRARGLRKDYGKGEGLVRAVDEVDLEVARGETLAVMGPSGCGKSTLLHLLGGLDRPSAGELWLDDRRIDMLSERALADLRRREIGFVFQAFQALVNEPLVVLADEPTGNLDSAATLDLLRLFKDLHAAGLTLVIVTHDERVAASADRLVSMRDGALAGETRLTGGGRDIADLIGLGNCDG